MNEHEKLKTHFPTAANTKGKAEKSELQYEDYIEGTRQVLVESQKETEPYEVNILGRKFVVNPNVFSPKYFNDTEPFARELPIEEGQEVLEIGPGTGAVSITAAYKGAEKVIAIDINPDAVKNTEDNIKIHEMEDKVEVRLGDVYSALKEGERFDVIFWNTPFGLVDDEDLSDIEKSVYDPGYKATERFIKEAQKHLNEEGKVYVGFSSTLGRLDLIEKFAEEAGMDIKLIYEIESEEVHPVKFEIFELTRQPTQ